MTQLRIWLDDGTPQFVGSAYVTSRAGRVTSAMFGYDGGYLTDASAFAIAPDLPLVSGQQAFGALPGVFADSSPDRWGRNLIARRIRAEAREAGARPATITEEDYLLGVSDATRQGALRFALEPDGPFLATGAEIPRLIALPELLHAADAVAGDGDDLDAVKLLLKAGTGSLGGARPKASVADGDRLLIAKFPHASDAWDVMAWEKTALDLAEVAGIRVPATRLVPVGGRSVLLVERFDRHGGSRVPYLSAMTLLEKRDGEGGDYAELVETLSEHGSDARIDVAELFLRVAFSVAINNTDDHLRNHGFLHERGGWRLSPVFDVNPNPDITEQRQTAVQGATDRRGVVGALRAAGSLFGLSPDGVEEAFARVRSALAGWRETASRNGVDARQLMVFEDAFDPRALG